MSNSLTAEMEEAMAQALAHFAPHLYVREPNAAPARITLSCNGCEHEIYRHGNDWRCAENCRCMMIGCIPKVWIPDAD